MSVIFRTEKIFVYRPNRICFRFRRNVPSTGSSYNIFAQNSVAAAKIRGEKIRYIFYDGCSEGRFSVSEQALRNAFALSKSSKNRFIFFFSSRWHTAYTIHNVCV